MLRDKLMQAADERGIDVRSMYLAGRKAWMVGNIIAIDPSVDDKQYFKNWVLAHELAHYDTCPFDLTRAPKTTQRKYERLADRTAALNVLPLETIISVTLGGCDNIDDLCDATELDAETVTSILALYQSIFGYNYKFGDYVFHSFLPVRIGKNDNRL